MYSLPSAHWREPISQPPSRPSSRQSSASSSSSRPPSLVPVHIARRAPSFSPPIIPEPVEYYTRKESDIEYKADYPSYPPIIDQETGEQEDPDHGFCPSEEVVRIYNERRKKDREARRTPWKILPYEEDPNWTRADDEFRRWRDAEINSIVAQIDRDVAAIAAKGKRKAEELEQPASKRQELSPIQYHQNEEYD